MFTPEDKAYLSKKGISIEDALQQRESLLQGIPYTKIVTPATVGNGIEQYNELQQKELIGFYEEVRKKKDIVKFVPASGAATRMFKHVSEFLEKFDLEEDTINEFLKQEENKLAKEFFENYKFFAFTNQIRKKIRADYPGYKKMTKGPRFQVIAKVLLNECGLGYKNLPKGLIPFHKYLKYATTAFEEQLYETAFYAASNEGVKIHFTFAEEHVEKFREKYAQVKKRIVKKTKTDLDITYSFQKKETDTIALDNNEQLVRKTNGTLLLRPSGHGALISNLNDINADVIFIKNIDNVVAEQYVPQIAYHKKVLAGKLVSVQKQVFKYLRKLDTGVTEDQLNEMKSFIWNILYVKSTPKTKEEIRAVLNKPLRVCGVVKNTGAPGGGPFWVQNNNEDSLQIVEAAQIDISDNLQKKMLEEATHFNPVDLVCGIKDYQGNPFNLLDFQEKGGGFISQKSYNGKTIRALERPGLWNGAMGNWNTIFVEVPLYTFNPVKTVNDLLKKEHRPLA